MCKEPNITPAMEKKHCGEAYIALDGKILGFGKDGIEAMRNAKKKMPDVENKAFLIGRILPKHVIA